jgi:hypothetical protein
MAKKFLYLPVILVISLLSMPVSCLVNRRAAASSDLPFSGISNKIADLVTEAFTSGFKANQNNQNRQDAVTIGSEQSTISSDNNSFMNGFLKLLGFDGRKIGAAAMNGIIFIAQMVRDTLLSF